MKVYLGHTSSKELIIRLNKLGWREMCQPREVPPKRTPFALDNYAFACFKNNLPWNAEGFMRGVEKCWAKKLTPDFVVVPDIVAGGEASLHFSLTWLQYLRGFAPLYLAVQDGMTLDFVGPYLDQFDGIFVGGTLPWKLASGFWWVALAHAIGKPCHVGRISGRARTCLVKSWGADSIDSCVPLWSAENLEAVVNGLKDPPAEFEITPAEQFLRGYDL